MSNEPVIASNVDEKGRPEPIAMSDRKMLEEILLNQRYIIDTVTDLLSSMKTNPMFKMMGMKGL